MDAHLDCIPCLLRQTLEAARLAAADPPGQEHILRAAAGLIAELPRSQPPPRMAAQVQRLIRRLAADDDPYRQLKQQHNRLALQALPRLQAQLAAAADPFELAVRHSIAGNIIDFGAPGDRRPLDLPTAAEQIRDQPLAIDHLDRLRQAASAAEAILYLGDNAGEIVFDQVLIAQLGAARVTYVVRGGPVLNDATLDDARLTGLTELVKVIDSGADVPGTVLDESSEQLRQLFAEADLIVSKGQGNYETLSEPGRDGLFYLLKVKCAIVARQLSCPLGSIIVKEAGRH